MTIEEALERAVKYEERVRDVYLESQKGTTNLAAKKVFGLMADEEAEHVAYLEAMLVQWRDKKELETNNLKTVIPSLDVIRGAVEKLEQKGQAPADTDLTALKKAYELEKETSDFYEQMVRDLPKEGRQFFARFVEIENGHIALVQAEIDAIEGAGFWFDTSEFDVERG